MPRYNDKGYRITKEEEFYDADEETFKTFKGIEFKAGVKITAIKENGEIMKFKDKDTAEKKAENLIEEKPWLGRPNNSKPMQ